jgi:hypothetical protein
MPQSTNPPVLTRHVRQTSYPHADRMTGLVVVAAIAASVALVFAGCSTPVAKPSLDLPARFASTSTRK